jgi:hypothetical protein
MSDHHFPRAMAKRCRSGDHDPHFAVGEERDPSAIRRNRRVRAGAGRKAHAVRRNYMAVRFRLDGHDLGCGGVMVTDNGRLSVARFRYHAQSVALTREPTSAPPFELLDRFLLHRQASLE